MKQILKTAPPPVLTHYVRTHRNLSWEKFSRPENASIKGVLGDWLRAEQGFLCCYCEEEIAKGVCHIEHFKPKSYFPELALDYTNLFASCNGCGTKEDLTCGMKKRNLYFPSLISPADPTCETRFLFTADGQILPVDEKDDRGWETIALLGLNSPKLRRRREMVYQELLNLRTLFSPEDFRHYVRIRLEKSAKGRFCEFWTTVRYFGEDGTPDETLASARISEAESTLESPDPESPEMAATEKTQTTNRPPK